MKCTTLQGLLAILGQTQKLAAGYLTPVGTPPNALETLVALKNQFDPYTLLNSPLPGMTNQVGAPNVLLTPARVVTISVGQDAIFLSDTEGRIDLSHNPQPAYLFAY